LTGKEKVCSFTDRPSAVIGAAVPVLARPPPPPSSDVLCWRDSPGERGLLSPAPASASGACCQTSFSVSS
jgi:hypothetical protein